MMMKSVVSGKVASLITGGKTWSSQGTEKKNSEEIVGRRGGMGEEMGWTWGEGG
jgi:hypothetical protein